MKIVNEPTLYQRFCCGSAARASGLQPLKHSKVFLSSGCKKEPLVPKLLDSSEIGKIIPLAQMYSQQATCPHVHH